MAGGLRRARDVVGNGTRKPERLFGGFWRKGELALLFGVAGVGKSLFAVQLADALARGTGIAGIDMPRKRHLVLYVDLILSDEQFSARYSRDTRSGHGVTAYEFAAGLARECPGEDEDLAAWVEEKCVSSGASVVIIDDLSAVSRSDDGTRETLRLVVR